MRIADVHKMNLVQLLLNLVSCWIGVLIGLLYTENIARYFLFRAVVCAVAIVAIQVAINYAIALLSKKKPPK